MLASQLCVFDDKTDLKWKWVKKIIVWLCFPNYLVYLWRCQSVMLSRCTICLMILCMHCECVMPYLTQEIRTKSGTADKVITKKHKEVVSNVKLKSKKLSNQRLPSISYRLLL